MGPWGTGLVRQALAVLVPYGAIVDQVLRGTGAKGHTFVVPESVWYNPDAPMYHYVGERAQSLLEEAGYGDGISASLHTSDTRERVEHGEIPHHSFARPTLSWKSCTWSGVRSWIS